MTLMKRMDSFGRNILLDLDTNLVFPFLQINCKCSSIKTVLRSLEQSGRIWLMAFADHWTRQAWSNQKIMRITNFLVAT